MKASNITAIPLMTSNTAPSGIVASSSTDSSSPAWRAFDGSNSTFWSTAYVSTSDPRSGWLKYSFVNPITIVKYSITSAGSYAPLSWTFEGSNDNTNWVVLDSQSNQTGWTVTVEREFTFTNNKNYLHYRINVANAAGVNNYLRIYELKMFNMVYDKRSFVFNNSEYKYFTGTEWINLTEHPTEQDYLSYGMDDLSFIPKSAWEEIKGEVELCYYTDDPTITEASFNIETIPFTLAEEWEDKQINVIEYTDDPNQTESIVTIETEPFTLYDELSDNVDVLYYTDDPSKTSADLNITANYSPLDELEGDFDVVTWTNDEESKATILNAIPLPQSIQQTEDYIMYGELLSIVDTLKSANGVLRYAVSFDSGTTWEICKFGRWRTVDISNLTSFKVQGMSHFDVSRIDSAALKDKGTKIRFAYYIDDNIHNSYPGIEIDSMKLNINSATETLKMSDFAFYVLNTNATIQLTLTGSKLTGKLDDSDKGKVQYRILLNDKPYYPSDGNFTRLAPSPLDIDINISDRDIVFNQPNKLKVEFHDYWGELDYWETTFIGTYSGLMFMDSTGEYLSDTFGGILKQLDFGIIIAGQTTLTQKVKLKNQLGYAIDNLLLEFDERYSHEGVTVQLSRQENPFLPIDYLTYGLTQPDDEIEFYVRIATEMTAKPNPNGMFELQVHADRV